MDLPAQRDTDDLDTTATPEAMTTEAVVAVPDVEDDATEHGVDADEAVSGEDMSDDTPLDELSDEDRAVLHAQWDAEINTVVLADPHEVLIAENVRTDNAEADDETTANLKTHGVKTATNGYRDYDTGAIVVTEGQRRVLNAREAGCELPVWMKTPPPADERKATIERIINQIIENDDAIRKPLTLQDTARGLQQLAAFNLTPTGIARKLVRGKDGKAYVENVLKAGRSELAVKAAERFQLDLLQAAVIAEFDEAGDTDTAKELIRIARVEPNNFRVFAESKRAESAENERFAALTEDLTDELTAAGITIFDNSLPDDDGDARSLERLRPTPEDEPRTELTAEDHAACPGHGAWIEEEYDEHDERMPGRNGHHRPQPGFTDPLQPGIPCPAQPRPARYSGGSLPTELGQLFRGLAHRPEAHLVQPARLGPELETAAIQAAHPTYAGHLGAGDPDRHKDLDAQLDLVSADQQAGERPRRAYAVDNGPAPQDEVVVLVPQCSKLARVLWGRRRDLAKSSGLLPPPGPDKHCRHQKRADRQQDDPHFCMRAHRHFSRVTGEVSQSNRFVSQFQTFGMLNDADHVSDTPPCTSAAGSGRPSAPRPPLSSPTYTGRPWLSVAHEKSAPP
jgi:hypothetical protein